MPPRNREEMNCIIMCVIPHGRKRWDWRPWYIGKCNRASGSKRLSCAKAPGFARLNLPYSATKHFLSTVNRHALRSFNTMRKNQGWFCNRVADCHSGTQPPTLTKYWYSEHDTLEFDTFTDGIATWPLITVHYNHKRPQEISQRSEGANRQTMQISLRV